MKKIIVAFMLLILSAPQGLAFNAAFLDQVQEEVFRSHALSERDAQKLLDMSSEATALMNITTVPASQSVEEVTPRENFSTATPRSIKHYSTVRKFQDLPKYLDLADRKSTSSLNLVRERQTRAQAKLARYRALFR